jgi:uncharacterized LabA/DUF88 family protein
LLGADVGLATKLVTLATNGIKPIARFVIVAGDGDFCDALAFLREQQKEVWVVGWGFDHSISPKLKQYALLPSSTFPC